MKRMQVVYKYKLKLKPTSKLYKTTIFSRELNQKQVLKPWHKAKEGTQSVNL